MLNTEIRTIPHLRHRYPTVGDYFNEYEKLIIHVSDMKNEKYEFLVAIHEQIEEFLTRLRGIKEEAITEFDKRYEDNRAENDYSEPGDSSLAPYIREHQFATFVEKMIAIELGVDWKEYEEAIIHLDEPTNTGA